MQTARDLLKKFNKVKTLPHVAIHLSQLIADENSTVKDFEKIAASGFLMGIYKILWLTIFKTKSFLF